ncbi:uncharacterized protein LOC141857533 [Brevipalpus obovatus]|uniref:uncharacterized protein LOC141857533 n=1 Tax=Brevipalpus obovatus TaxID=246614 RepID=UPI003D9DC121
MYHNTKILQYFYYIFFILVAKISADSQQPKLDDVESNQLQLIAEGFTKLFWQQVENSGNQDKLVSKECWNDLKTITVKNNVSIDFFDRLIKLSGKFPKNFDKGHLVDYGDYKACLQPSQSNKLPTTQYCLVSAIPDFHKLHNLSITNSDVDRIFQSHYDVPIGRFVEIGICTIASCNATDISMIFREVFAETYWTAAGPIYCQSDLSFLGKLRRASIAQKLSVGLFSFLFLSVLSVSFLDLMLMMKLTKESHSIWTQIFSPTDSLRMLVSPVNPERLIFFDGLRLFTYIYVFLYHTSYIHMISGAGVLIAKMSSLSELSGKWLFQPFVSRFYFSALPFFGGLSAATFLLNRGKNVSSVTDIFKVLLTRFLQYQPIILAAIALETLLPLIGSGPIYSRITEKLSDNCANRFWLNILHISNLPLPPEMCFIPGWTISVEFQLLLIAAPLYYITNRRRNVGKTLTLITSLIGFGYLISVFVMNDMPPIDTLNPVRTIYTYLFLVLYHMRTLPHIWIFLWPFFMITLIEDGFHQNFSKLSRRITVKICYFLLILTSFSPAYYNIYGSKVESFSTVIFLLINYGIFWITCSAILLRYGDEFLVLLGRQARIDTEMNPKGGELKDGDQKLMSQNQIKSAPMKTQKVPPRWFDVFLRIARSVFFCHLAVSIWYNVQVSEPFQLMSGVWFYHMGMTFMAIFIGAIIFQIFVIGPMTRVFELSRKKIR